MLQGQSSYFCDSDILVKGILNTNFEWIIDNFLGNVEENRSKALSIEKQICIFSSYVGDSGFQTGVAKDICIH